MGRMSDAGKLLRIYVNDHRAASTGGVALAERAARNNQGTELSADLEWLCAQLRDDADALATIADRLGIAENPVKRELARAGEVVGRLKLNGSTVGYSPLSRLLEIEMLLAGIDGKQSLWRSLAAVALPELHDVDLHRLVQRASEQRERLMPHHERAAVTALGRHPAPTATSAGSPPAR
jgi:hypothetical protein